MILFPCHVSLKSLRKVEHNNKMKKILIFLLGIMLFVSSREQTVGSKVSLTAVDGKAYTGTITKIQGDKYNVKYDGFDFEAWLTGSQFTVVNANLPTPNTVVNQPQQNGNWKVGDKVQVRTSSMDKWEDATVFLVLTDRTPAMYKARLDNPGNYATTDPLLSANQIRARGLKANTFTVKNRVDVYYASGGPKARATVIEEKGNGRYKVRYDGCKAYLDEEVDWSQLKPESVVSSTDGDITAVFGKWAMFVYSYPNTVIRGNNIYREYGTGAKAPPLLINANGTYVWYDEYNKPPVKGTWTSHAKINGITMGTEAVNGIILKDSYGIYWKVYKDRQDHIEARKMCSGETEGGSRIK